MDRTFHFERVYNLGNYETVRFGDTIVGVAEELALNPEVISALRMMQIVHTEKAYFTYMQKKNIFHQLSIEDALALLNEANHQSVRNLKDIITEQTTEKEENN